MSRKLLFALVVVAVTALIYGVIATRNAPLHAVSVGAILPLTGESSSYGNDARIAIEIAFQQGRTDSSKRKIQCVFEDDQMSASKAVSAMNKLLQIDKPIAIVGAFSSSSTLAIAPLAEARKVVVISPTASSPDITNSGDYIFRNWPSDAYETALMLHSLKSFAPGVKSLAVAAVKSDYGDGTLSFITQHALKEGFDLVKKERFPPNTTDFRVILESLKMANPDAVYFIGYYADVALALRQAKETGMTSQALSVSACEDARLVELAGDAAEGLVYTRPARADDHGNSLLTDFVKEFQRIANKEPSIAARQAYDAARLIAAGIDNGASTSTELQRYLGEVKDFHGVGGTFSFDANGDAVVPMELAIVRNGKFEPLTRRAQ